jgi:hypothetical protein
VTDSPIRGGKAVVSGRDEPVGATPWMERKGTEHLETHNSNAKHIRKTGGFLSKRIGATVLADSL